MAEFKVNEVTVFRVATFLKEVLPKIYFLKPLMSFLRNIQHNYLYKSGLPNVISTRYNKFR